MRRDAGADAEGGRPPPHPAPHGALEGRVLRLRGVRPALLAGHALGADREDTAAGGGGLKRGLFVNLALASRPSSSSRFSRGPRGSWRGRGPPKAEVADYIWDWDEKMPGGFYVTKSDAAGWPPWEEFNGDGLRDRTRTREKPEGYRRIAILGDSVTYGAEIRTEEAYPRRLRPATTRSGGPSR